MKPWYEGPCTEAAEALEAIRTANAHPCARVHAASCPELSAMLMQGALDPAVRMAASASWDYLLEVTAPALGAMHRAGIPVWAWKGFDFARTLYPSPWMRPMRDADLLVTRRDFDGAVNSFVSAGWEEVAPGRPLITSGLVGGVVLSVGRVSVDLHSSPLHFPATLPGRLPGDLLEGGRAIAPGLLAPSFRHSLLLCVMHLLSHRPPRQIWWVDCALLADRLDARDWRAFSFDAVRTGLGREMGAALLAAREGMGARVPPGVISALSSVRSRGRLFGLTGLRGGMATLAALVCSRGWRKTSFAAALAYRLARGLPAAAPVRRKATDD